MRIGMKAHSSKLDVKRFTGVGGSYTQSLWGKCSSKKTSSTSSGPKKDTPKKVSSWDATGYQPWRHGKSAPRYSRKVHVRKFPKNLRKRKYGEKNYRHECDNHYAIRLLWDQIVVWSYNRNSCMIAQWLIALVTSVIRSDVVIRW